MWYFKPASLVQATEATKCDFFRSQIYFKELIIHVVKISGGGWKSSPLLIVWRDRGELFWNNPSQVYQLLTQQASKKERKKEKSSNNSKIPPPWYMNGGR